LLLFVPRSSKKFQNCSTPYTLCFQRQALALRVHAQKGVPHRMVHRIFSSARRCGLGALKAAE
jgi:hypothetical protein